MNYWQVVAGDKGRDYSDEFIRFGMAFGGLNRGLPLKEKVKHGDRIIQKSGIKKIRAVGKVVERDGKASVKGDKDWLCYFDGWELPNYYYVEWHKLPKPKPVAGLVQGTVRKVKKIELKKIVDKLLEKLPVTAHDPKPEPTGKVEDSEILEFLIRGGTPSRSG